MNKGKIKNIAFDYILSKTPETRGTVILLPGLPSTPKQYDFVSILEKKGFDIFILQYEGTWDSDGIFLEKNPITTINEFLLTLTAGTNLENTPYHAKKIYIIGTSFGGSIALSLNNTSWLSKICVLSPVIDFKKVSSIETLGPYLLNKLANSYRFKESNWQKLINGDYVYPPQHLLLPPEKILIFAGNKDDQISVNEIESFSSEKNIHIEKIDSGHLTFSKIDSFLLEKILTFFEKE